MRPRRRGASSREDVVELILGELDPIIMRTKDALAQVWHNRSVSKANLHVLMLLEQFGPLPMSRLATMVDVSLPNMTGIVDRMEEHGLVERLRNDEDRRVVMVRATDKGTEVTAEIPRLRREFLRRVVCALPEGERKNCYEAFRAFRVAAESLTDEPIQSHPTHAHGRRGRAGTESVQQSQEE